MNILSLGRFFSKSVAGLTAVFTLLSGALGVFVYYFPSGPLQDPDFFGRWESRYEYHWNGERVSYRGNIQYIRNGRYNVSGVFDHSGYNSGNQYQYSIQAKGSGNWSRSEDFLTVMLTNLRWDVLRYSVIDQEMPERIINKFKSDLTAELNEKYVPGSSDEYKIVSVEKNKIVMVGKDPGGHPFKMISTRKDSIL